MKITNDLKLARFLRENLNFGCIKSCSIKIEDEDENNKKRLTVCLQPYRTFYESDISFIREYALQLAEQKIANVRIKFLYTTVYNISAVYIIG